MCPAWPLAVALLVGVATGSANQCWENSICQEVHSESSVMECIQLCRSDLSAERPQVPGDAHLQPLPPPEFPPPLPLSKRSYSMEHFRWGKPVGLKRRPIKVYIANDVDEESKQVLRRREPAEGEELEEDVEQHHLPGGVYQKKDGTYKMRHFRWGAPPAAKRYGGFMKGWDEHSQRPLIALFKNVINKDGEQHE
ncbi:pro-opiomelanocortin-like isoform X2 [Dunckerocampus dactyliophorus]|nr:pro-opiomelanocortin-like isoform X2 [Dunckerocampus dactyliophorus]XP_054619112.1 pro-opiomelanocortin-like isoform X2 [Dunckerocampus dactyliophorus]XP_054619113.1 pro-opiomelanocortin-like isoform X2 [Dunckerocampus dactyliophorus]XP_054619114.1 pro-opiomelanocortin-like isoform X2 [Dunckerocampus dactyliophorus]XP_054619115.1 pro-opiomelanocortin-like isoform X2 [Dunckerocampus dactyliophorus]XP_054619117.1 pro-opiomelanocortin-like isoform X2 [Dunckerocampus dactyliophorus]